MRKRVVTLVVVVGTVVLASMAESPADAYPGTGSTPESVCGTPNGCGPAGGPVTVDGYPGVSFRAACTTHDYCYATLGKTQADCDNAFRSDMYALCAKQNAGAECQKMADAFYSAPAKLPQGKDAYEKAQSCAKTVLFTNGEVDADFILANAKTEGASRAEATAKSVLGGSADKRTAIQAAAAETKANTIAIHQYAGMTYTFSMPASGAVAGSSGPSTLQPSTTGALAALATDGTAKQLLAVCAGRTGNDLQLCQLANSSKAAADATGARVPKDDMTYDDRMRELLRGPASQAIVAKYVDAATAAARDAKATYARWKATSSVDVARKGLLQLEATKQIEDARLKWNAILSEIDREMRGLCQAPFTDLLALERDVNARNLQVRTWKGEAERIVPPPTIKREAPRKIVR